MGTHMYSWRRKNKCQFVVKKNALELLVSGLDGALGGSVGCAVRLETRRSRVQPLPSCVTH